ncbi:glycosyltransferase family 2 protein [Clostridium algidicarnis]|uniref:glycosyltransferase family 2 protein n=1 Tax=Clostridium algidicarnis TaxID=37659 RepID=UPI001C0B517B|nr:glycosyltransferase family 2 protein [Clostridium algidicarnis]MBU3208670.1 glycosyltransferase [Clostridium algidicarnis]MBU3226823.1 glycosyltransferase [Clostridium algidicarnis]MBU3250266.1 glycosyltransferase [Clostridium algidicarnis]
MDVLNSFIQILSATFTNLVFIISTYYLFLSFFGIIRFKSKKQFEPKKSFALIVAAYNEENVIQNIIHSLDMLDYPKELYDIIVIADNCTDSTAKKARKSGANVFERNMKDKKGKGYALEWIFDKIFKMEKSYDAVVILDADNLVDKNFLKEMNNKLCDGHKVIQGYLDSKNPNDTWITGGYSIAFWTSNRMFQLSRSNLRLSNQLGGTGFCIDTSILKELGWGATCLTEDLEFTCKLVLNGYKVGWAHDAIIYDEKPLTLAQSWAQRKRWMQGFADVSSRYFFKLIKKAIKEFNFVALDCALYTIQPVIIILAGIAMIMNLFHSFVAAPQLIATTIQTIKTANFTMIKLASVLAMIMQFVYTPFILILEKKLSLKIFLYYLIYPIYAATWLPISIQGIIHKDNKEWSHTLHTRNIKIHDLEKAN